MDIRKIIKEEVTGPSEVDRLFIKGYLTDFLKLTRDYADRFEAMGDIKSAEQMRRVKPDDLALYINRL